MLDPFTTLFTTALTTAACGTLLLLCFGRDGNPSLITLAVALILATLGFVIAAALNGGGGLLESVEVAILICASSLFWTATRLFRGASANWIIAAAGPAAWLGTAALQTRDPLWTAAACAIGAAYTVASVRELYRIRGEHLASWLPVIALTAVHATVYSLRTLFALGQSVAPDHIVAPAWIGIALLLEAMVHINGSTIALVSLFREHQERRASNDLRIAAYQDSLTGIANRRRFDERLNELASDLRQRHAQFGLIMIDLDRFKSVNDTVGHNEGDRILCMVARIIASNVRPDTDLAARYGGEEFAVIVGAACINDLWSAAERIRAAVEAAAIPHPGTGGVVTVSMGISIINAGDLSGRRQGYLFRTDQALYRAKQLGRNRVFAAAPIATQDPISTTPFRAA